jgi:hypothetical protein
MSAPIATHSIPIATRCDDNGPSAVSTLRMTAFAERPILGFPTRSHIGRYTLTTQSHQTAISLAVSITAICRAIRNRFGPGSRLCWPPGLHAFVHFGAPRSPQRGHRPGMLLNDGITGAVNARQPLGVAICRVGRESSDEGTDRATHPVEISDCTDCWADMV